MQLVAELNPEADHDIEREPGQDEPDQAWVPEEREVITQLAALGRSAG
jgi:hypothetical protein